MKKAEIERSREIETKERDRRMAIVAGLMVPSNGVKTDTCESENVVVIYADGLCEPCNPGGTATAAWLARQNGRVIARGGWVVATGATASANVAEYAAVIGALKWAVAKGLKGVEIRSDSQLVVNQVEGKWQVRSPRLQRLCDEARKLAEECGARLAWIPRSQNREADELTQEVYRRATGWEGQLTYGAAATEIRRGSREHRPSRGGTPASEACMLTR